MGCSMDESDGGSLPNEPDHGPAQVISQGALGSVALCECGHLHLTLQYLTLRFERPAFRELAALLMSAQRRLDTDLHPQNALASAGLDVGPDKLEH
jgi:hypothetical protein